MGQTDRWALPDEPGPDVTHVYDRHGCKHLRHPVMSNSWQYGPDMYCTWRRLLVNEGPLTRHPPEANHG